MHGCSTVATARFVPEGSRPDCMRASKARPPRARTSCLGDRRKDKGRSSVLKWRPAPKQACSRPQSSHCQCALCRSWHGEPALRLIQGTSSVAFKGERLHLKCAVQRNRRFIVSQCAFRIAAFGPMNAGKSSATRGRRSARGEETAALRAGVRKRVVRLFIHDSRGYAVVVANRRFPIGQAGRPDDFPRKSKTSKAEDAAC